MTMLKLCNCGKPIPITEKRCATCTPKVKNYERQRDRQKYKRYNEEKRDPELQKFYNSKGWQKTRQVVLVRDNGLCVSCLKSGRTKEAKVVDHIVPIKISMELKLNINNLQSLCDRCHAKKTKDDKLKYKL